jgi:hypothetical protein
MHKYELLRLRAEELRGVLEEYARKDPDVRDFLDLWMPWYERIQRREIRLPCYEYKLDVYFFHTDITPNFLCRFIAKFDPNIGWVSLNHPLGNAIRNFSTAIRDDLSDANYLDHLKQSNTCPDLIPDEPPPPEEEALLPQREKPESPKTREDWIDRWMSNPERIIYWLCFVAFVLVILICRNKGA